MEKKAEKHYWTKEEMKVLISIWDKKTLDEICKELNLRRIQVSYMANQMRKCGIGLVKKKKLGITNMLIDEVKKELGI